MTGIPISALFNSLSEGLEFTHLIYAHIEDHIYQDLLDVEAVLRKIGKQLPGTSYGFLQRKAKELFNLLTTELLRAFENPFKVGERSKIAQA